MLSDAKVHDGLSRHKKVQTLHPFPQKIQAQHKAGINTRLIAYDVAPNELEKGLTFEALQIAMTALN
jgi:hypothetical protein